MKQAVFALLLASCAHNVAQDAATGKDGKIKGAEPIALENGEGVAKGIVTYPGGDRVDWRSITLPENKRGTLALALTYTTPRPGLKVAFDVFDAYRTPVVAAALHGKSREAKIDHAVGTYFVRVFAPKRGDAGAYKLVASFTEDPPPPPPMSAMNVPDPPHLAAVPPPVEACLQFDAKNPECGHECPDDAPPNWKPCRDACRTPDANNPACQATMTCTAPDTRVADCMKHVDKWWKVCDWTNPDSTNPRCNGPQPPVPARIIKVDEEGDDVVVWISAGTKDRVQKGWNVTVLEGSTENPLPGGTGKVQRAEKNEVRVKLHLRRDVVEKNVRVRLSPSP